MRPPLRSADLTPRQIVAELDRYIVGQDDAKRAVAIAIRNRWRRQQLPDELRQDVSPKNILMIGPTGVGKTEIARRLAKLTGAPFIKVEATKYTEVGYYGRDVESMVRELVETAIGLVRQRERSARSRTRPRSARRRAAARPARSQRGRERGDDGEEPLERRAASELRRAARWPASWKTARSRSPSRRGPRRSWSAASAWSIMDIDLQGMFEKILPKQTEPPRADRRRGPQDPVRAGMRRAASTRTRSTPPAIELAENLGIIFLDELDKIVATDSRGADVSRQGVQRDLLPIVEGTHGANPLRPRADRSHPVHRRRRVPQGQAQRPDARAARAGFPIRVELKDLTKDDFVRILTEPKNSLTQQYAALLETEGVDARIHRRRDRRPGRLRLRRQPDDAEHRRPPALHDPRTPRSKTSRFEAPDMQMGQVKITAEYVKERLNEVAEDEDLSRYISDETLESRSMQTVANREETANRGRHVAAV